MNRYDPPRVPAEDTDPETGRRPDGTLDRAYYDPPVFRVGINDLETDTKYTEHLDFPPSVMAETTNDNQFAPDQPSLLKQWGTVLPLVGFGTLIAVSKGFVFLEPELGPTVLAASITTFGYLLASDDLQEKSTLFCQKRLDERLEATKESQKVLKQCVDIYKREVKAGETYRAFSEFQSSVFEKASAYYAWKFQHDVRADVLARLRALERAETEKLQNFESGRVNRALDSALTKFAKDPKMQTAYLRSYVNFALGKAKSFEDPLEQSAKQALEAENAKMKQNVDKEFKYTTEELNTMKQEMLDLQKSETLSWIGDVPPAAAYVPRLTGLAGPIPGPAAEPFSGAKVLKAIKDEAKKAEAARYGLATTTSA